MGKVPRRRRSRELTDRQLLILRMMAQARSMEEMSRPLGISVNTVKYHVREILAKLNAKNRGHALVIAMREGLLR
jgi:DNA-binding CsgD family transcriptional regulator